MNALVVQPTPRAELVNAELEFLRQDVERIEQAVAVATSDRQRGEAKILEARRILSGFEHHTKLMRDREDAARALLLSRRRSLFELEQALGS